MMRTLCIWLIAGASVVLVACQPQVQEVERTVMVTQLVVVQGTPVVQVVTATPEPTQEVERTLVVCLGQEPDTLYSFASTYTPIAKAHVLQAVYDGGETGVDSLTFSHQAVIHERLPSLAGEDASIKPIAVQAGDQVIGRYLSDPVVYPLELQAGVLVRPSGCRSADCEVEYDGSSPIEMDQMIVEHTLLAGLQWSDGAPLTSLDEVYAFELQSDPATPGDKYLEARTASYEALDERTTRWTGLPGFLDPDYDDNFWAPRPRHVWGQYTAAELLDSQVSTVSPLGYGPFVIDGWVKGDHISLHRNERYFRAAEGLPQFEHLIFRFVGENPNANLARLLAGECDLLDQTARLDEQSELLLELDAAGQIVASFAPAAIWEHVDFGIQPAAYDNGWRAGDRPAYFSDLRTRQAIALCMDRQAVVEQVLSGQSVVMDSYLPAMHPLFNPDVTRYTYDVEEGTRLLELAGWVDEDGIPETTRVYRGEDERIPPGTPLAFRVSTSATTLRQSVREVLVESMAACGIQVTLEDWNVGEYFADGPDGPMFGRQFDLALLGWLVDSQPTCALFMTEGIPATGNGWTGDNITGYSSPEFDEACGAAVQALPGEAGYRENHLAAQEIFSRDLPVVPLFQRFKLAAARADLTGFVVDPSEPSEMWNIENIDDGK